MMKLSFENDQQTETIKPITDLTESSTTKFSTNQPTEYKETIAATHPFSSQEIGLDNDSSEEEEQLQNDDHLRLRKNFEEHIKNHLTAAIRPHFISWDKKEFMI